MRRENARREETDELFPDTRQLPGYVREREREKTCESVCGRWKTDRMERSDERGERKREGERRERESQRNDVSFCSTDVYDDGKQEDW